MVAIYKMSYDHLRNNAKITNKLTSLNMSISSTNGPELKRTIFIDYNELN
jgi:hypothetical protein